MYRYRLSSSKERQTLNMTQPRLQASAARCGNAQVSGCCRFVSKLSCRQFNQSIRSNSTPPPLTVVEHIPTALLKAVKGHRKDGTCVNGPSATKDERCAEGRGEHSCLDGGRAFCSCNETTRAGLEKLFPMEKPLAPQKRSDLGVVTCPVMASFGGKYGKQCALQDARWRVARAWSGILR